MSIETSWSQGRPAGASTCAKGEQTRQEIIRKAAPIFNQRGYEGVTLSELMQATGLEKGGIYRHFDSKQQFASEAFDYAWSKAVEARLGRYAGNLRTRWTACSRSCGIFGIAEPVWCLVGARC